MIKHQVYFKINVKTGSFAIKAEPPILEIDNFFMLQKILISLELLLSFDFYYYIVLLNAMPSFFPT